MELSSKVTVVVRNGLVSIVAVVAAIGAFASVDPLVNPEMGWPLKDLATLGTAPVVLPLIVVLEFDVDPDGGPAHEAEACQSSEQPRLTRLAGLLAGPLPPPTCQLPPLLHLKVPDLCWLSFL